MSQAAIMSEREESADVRTSMTPGRQRGDVWAVVLAGGQGVRLQPLARRVCGDERPKQYVPLLEARTLLEQTLDRVALAIPEERTVVVTVRSHAPYVVPARSRRPAPQVLAHRVAAGASDFFVPRA